MAEIIRFQSITKKFPGVIALEEVSFSIQKGEIHAIVGENGAGKTTLMHILGGEIHPDSGEILLNGMPVTIPDPHAARRLGISIVYQELKLCPNLSVVENIFLGREKEDGRYGLNWKEKAERCQEFLLSLGLRVNPHILVKNLTIAEQQIVEIAKAISLKSDILILDEPNSALSLNETENLFRNLAYLKKNGVTILFISHRLEEVLRISDRVSVLRDGKYLGTFLSGSTDIDQLVTLIAGKQLVCELSKRRSEESPASRPVVLEVRGLSRNAYFRNINFYLYEKEILGIYGLQGSGRTELLESIFGVASPESGELVCFGKKIRNANPQQAIQHGFAMVPEDRRKAGLFSNMDVKENINTSNTNDISHWGIIKQRKLVDIAHAFVGKLSIKAGTVFQKVKNLSGGNQQKVIISRWLATKPRIFLVDELTRGIDVGAKAEIYRILQGLRETGLSIILVSSELQEIVAECDRVLVMRNGQIVANVTGNELEKETILRYTLKG